ncbi:MAG TPA: thioredoxin family protein [Bacteroidales bacterium]|nr:thioredoxin family protein [Bacteroidales bacterium]
MKILFTILMILAMTLGTAQAQGYQVGDKATDFKLKNIDGRYVSMADYPDAKGFVVIFSCNHCPFVVATEDRIIALDKKYKEKGFPVIAINPNDPELVPADSFEKMQERAQEKGFTFPYLFDEGQKIYPVYGATRTPHVFLLERQGEDLVVAYIGAIDDNTRDASEVEEKYLENAINALLAGQRPDPDFTRAIGCTIKAKN